MFYTGKCPRCSAIVRSGHGGPIKRIDTPIRKCHQCSSTYIDDNMYEWAVISLPYKLYYIFFANNRFLGWLLLLYVAIAQRDCALIGFVTWVTFCVLWFLITKRGKVSASRERSKNADYIAILSKSNYDKLAQKYDIYY